MTLQQLRTAISREGNTPERAKALFSMVVGPLPGVAVLASGRDPTDFDGTYALTYLHQFWDSLTPEQRDAATALVTGMREVRAEKGTARRVLAAGLIPDFHFAQWYQVSDQTPAWDYKKLAGNADSALAAYLHVDPIYPNFDVSIDYDPPEGTEYAHTWSWTWGNVLKWDKGCHIFVWNQKFQGLDESDAEAVLTHEMFHCYQQRLAGTPLRWGYIKGWIGDGEATWAMQTVVHPSPKSIAGIYEGIWNLYVFGPLTRYSDRQYDAFAVYGHLGDVAGNDAVWPRLLPLVVAALNGSDDAAFKSLISGYESQFYSAWGASYFLEPAAHWQWGMQSPGQAPDHGPAPTSVTVNSATDETLTPVEPYQSGLVQLSGDADIVVVKLLTGYGRLHDHDFAIDTALEAAGPLALCVKTGGCKCPDGSPGASLSTKLATMPVSIGINGGDTTAVVGVAGQSLDRFCQKPQSKTPASLPPGGGGGSGRGGGGAPPSEDPQPPPPEGGSAGDTHLTTFDGVHYDFQVVGEYTLVRSTKDDLLVQVRQVPVKGPRVASVNQAVALKVGSQRVTITLQNGKPVLRVDGAIVGGALPALKAGSLTQAITAFGDTYQVTWSDGTIAHVNQLGAAALNVTIVPNPSRRAGLEGLLGNFDGSPDNDLIAKGRNLGVNVSREDINRTLADAWRVDQGESLFDYEPGRTTASYVDPQFPAKDADAGRIANRETAEKTCREEGITDQHLLDDCILDLAVTNEFLFASQYAHAQQVLAARALIATARSNPKRETIWMSDEIDNTGGTVSPGKDFHFDARAGDVIWVGHDHDCSDGLPNSPWMDLALLDPSGKPLVGPNKGCEIGWSELPATGTYTFHASFPTRGQRTRWHIPIRFVRHVRRAAIRAGSLIEGTIDDAQARDYYSFEARQGDFIVLSGEACHLFSIGTVIEDDQNRFLPGPNCNPGTRFKVERDGHYELIINYDGTPEPGPYKFVFQQGTLTE